MVKAQKISGKAYHKRWIRTRWKRLGKKVCPKCGRTSQTYLKVVENRKTGHVLKYALFDHGERTCIVRWMDGYLKGRPC